MGVHSLQAYCALAIQSYFWMVVHNGQKGIEASVIAAESHGFAKNWGGRLVGLVLVAKSQAAIVRKGLTC